MSNEVTSIAQKRVLGSATRKTVLMYLADRASDDGSGVWTSKAHIAADTELSKRTVQNVMSQFEEEGVLEKTGQRPCQNGYTFEYRLNLNAIKSLPSTRNEAATGAGDSPVGGVQEIHGVHHVHLTGAGDSPQDVHHVHPNHPRTIHEPPKRRERDLFSDSSDQKPQIKVDGDFDEFWKAYPKKAGKDAARKAWAKAIKREAPQRIIIAANRYSEFLNSIKPGEFKPQAKHPQGWLNDGRWDEYLDRPQKPNSANIDVSPGSPIYVPGTLAKKYAGIDARPPEEIAAARKAL